PALDLASNDLLMRRPDARPASASADPAYVEIGAWLTPIMLETQKVTLAGFRILDPHGVVIAGRQEVGQSLAHIEEVATALKGQYRAALRIRKLDKIPPPIYSISRGVGVHVFSAMPVIVDNHVAGVIYTSRTPSNIFDHLYQERGKFLLAGLAVIAATVIIGLVFYRTITRPMHELVGRAGRISRLDSRVPTRHIAASGCLDRPIGMSGEKALIVLSHLADNAVRHNAKSMRLEAETADATVRMIVSNDGDPISESNREKIFDAFFTTRRDTGGTGMGLAIVQAVMTSHRGSIRPLPTEQGAAFE